MAAVNAVGRAAGLEPLEPIADARAGALYERHARRVYAFCLSRLARREDAEDAAQTTFLHAVNGLRRGVTPGHELAWLLGIARNVCLARLESAGRRRRLELVCDPVDLERNVAPGGRRDELIGLEHALARLPEQQRRAVLLRDWRGLSYEEVAAQLGVSLANAETLIFRGRRTLAELLQEEPTSTRRRLASFGSLFTWAKSAFTGAAAVSKLAAAAAVVAISGAAVAAGSSTSEPERRTPAPTSTATAVEPAPAPAVANAPLRNQSPGVPPVSERASAPPPAPARDETERAAPAAPGPAGSAPQPTAQPPAAEPDATPKAPTRVRRTAEAVQSSVEKTAPVLAPVTEPIVDAVGSLAVPEPPIAAPLVETVVEAVPPVAAPTPPVDAVVAAPNLLP